MGAVAAADAEGFEDAGLAAAAPHADIATSMKPVAAAPKLEDALQRCISLRRILLIALPSVTPAAVNAAVAGLWHGTSEFAPFSLRALRDVARSTEERPRIFGFMRSVRVATLWLAIVAAGVATGLWMASMTSYCGLCLVAPARFATWECCLVGFAVSAIGYGATVVFWHDFLRSSLSEIGRLWRFLFEDLVQHQTD
jgi:hypothetical protein